VYREGGANATARGGIIRRVMSVPRPRFSRRHFLRNLGIGLSIPAGIAGWAMGAELYWPEFPTVPMPIRNLPPAFEGLRIAHLTDLHISSPFKHRLARAVVDQVNLLRPDIAVVTGDLVTQNSGWVDEACDTVAALRMPTYVSLGNHDYGQQVYRGRTVDTAAEIKTRLDRVGCVVLRNEATAIEKEGARIWVMGLEDLWSGRFAPAQVFAGIDLSSPVLALSHNPDTGAALNNYGASWVFAGHTHGGQIRIPGYGAVLLNVQNRSLQQGLIEMPGGRMYISRGIGYLSPARFCCRPEVPIFVATRI
jgi:uncharacterized protein